MGTRTARRGGGGEGVVRVEMDGKGEMSDKRGDGSICDARAAGEKRSGGRRRGGVHAAGPPPPHDLKKMVPVRASEHKGLNAASAGKTGTGLAPELWRASRRHVRRERRMQSPGRAVAGLLPHQRGTYLWRRPILSSSDGQRLPETRAGRGRKVVESRGRLCWGAMRAHLRTPSWPPCPCR